MRATETADVLSAISRASARAAGSSASGSSTRLTRPPARASSAENTRPVYVHSAACATPTSRGRNHVLAASGTTPRREHEADLRRARSEAHVHRQRQRDAEADGGTVDGGDHRLLHLEDAQRDEPATVAMLLGRLASAVERRAAASEIRARAERAAGARDDHHAHAVVGVGAVERGDELADDGGVDR